MHTTPSLQALAIFLSLAGSVQALVVQKPNKPAQELYREARRGLTPDKRQNPGEEVLDCPDTEYQRLLDTNPRSRIVTVCNALLGLDPVTTVVEVTPTLTITNNIGITTSYTTTTRLITTRTVTETATTTRTPVARRAANIVAVAEDVIESVIESGSIIATTSKSPQRIEAESGLASACTCETVTPISTVTSSFTVPAVTTTVGARKVYIVRRTDTKVFTSTTTVTEYPSSVSAAPSNTNTSGAQAPNPSISNAPPATRLTETDLPSSKSSGSGNPVVTAIPFNCPGDAGKHIDQVVGGIRIDYLVLCDTEVVTQKPLGPPIAVDSTTACAGQCSLVNAQSGQDICQAASFEPSTGGKSGGFCILSGSEPKYVTKRGSITVVHTGTFANGDECRGLEASASRTPVDTSALIASITAAPFSLSTPGLVTESANGGVYQTYVSANSTDASGYVHWSWYEVSASSSYWWAVYSTSWACTATLTRTIVTLPSDSVTVTSELVTTIIKGGITTIISGTSTSTLTNGGGVAPPTFVPATTTNSNGETTTIFSLATQTSNGSNGLIPPTATPTAAGNATVSGSTQQFFSTGQSGLVVPSSLAQSGDALTIIFTGDGQASTSGSTIASSRNGSEGVVPPPSTIGGSARLSSSGSTFAAESTGDSGVVTPSINTLVSSTASPTVQEGSNSTIFSTGSFALTISGSTATAASTGDFGIIPPGSSADVVIVTSKVVISGSTAFATSGSTLASNSTGNSGIIPPKSTRGTVTVTRTVTSGFASFATSDSTIAFASTGASGIIPPASSAKESTDLISVTSGAASFATSGSTIKSSGTGNLGVIPPFSTTSAVLPSSSAPTTEDVTITVTVTILPSTSVAIANITSIGGSNGVTVQQSTAVISSTGGNGIVTPGTASVPRANSTSTGPTFTNSGGDRTGGFSQSTSLSVTRGSSGVIMPSSNSTMSAPPSATPTPSGNSTSTGPTFTNSGGDRTGGFSQYTSLAVTRGSSGVIRPSSNSTISALVSATPTPSDNSTSTGPTFTNSGGDRTGGFSQSTRIAISSGSSGVIRPSSNSTTPAPPSQTPTPSLNVTSTGPPFTNSGGDRTGGFSTSSALVSSFGSSGVIVPSSNGSMTVPPTTTPTPGQNTTSTGPPFTNTDDLRSGSFSQSSSIRSNSTRSGTGGSGSPTPTPSQSTTLVILTATVVTTPVSVNASTSVTTPSSLTQPFGSSSGVPTPSSNSTTRFPTAASSSLPPVSINSTSSAIPSSSLVVVTLVSNTTSAPTGASSSVPPFSNSTIQIVTLASTTNVTSFPSVTPSPSLNVTSSVFFPTGNTSIPSVTPSPSLNITSSVFFPTGNSSLPSATPTISLNSTTPLSICPTAPILVTVTAVETSIQFQTTTLVQTVTVGIISTSSEVVSATSSPAASSSVVISPAAVSPAVIVPDTTPREFGQPATPAQIKAACDNFENIVRNPNFALNADKTVSSWSVNDTDPSISIGSERAPTGSGSIAQFKSAIVGRTLTIRQALVLCPGKQYAFSALTRQAHKEAGCTVEYVIGNDTITENTPAETWLETQGFFTAGAGVEGASADLQLTASCKGVTNIPASNLDDWMRVEVSGVSVTQDEDLLKKMKMMMRGRKRGALEAQRAQQQGYAAVVFEDEESG